MSKVEEARQDNVILWSIRFSGLLFLGLGVLIGFTSVVMPAMPMLGVPMIVVGALELLFLGPWIVRRARAQRAGQR